MYCPRCHHSVDDDAKFCAYCGLKIERCPYCHQPIMKDSRYCEHCGHALYSQEYNQGYYEPLPKQFNDVKNEKSIEKPSKKVNKWLIIALVAGLLISTVVAFNYVQDGGMPVDSKEEIVGSFEVKPQADSIAHVGNINQGGHVAVDKDLLYIVNDEGQLVSMNTKLENHRILIDQPIEYLNIVDDVIYYTNKDHAICKAQLDGTKQEVLLSVKAYYMIVLNDKIYYQNDSDSESIYVYDLKSQKNQKINERHSYNLNIVDDHIYYTSRDGIYMIGLDGQGDEKIIDGQATQLIYRDGKLYYTRDSGQVESYDLSHKKIENLTDGVSQLVNVTQDYLFYNTREGLHRYSFKSEKDVIIDSHIYTFVEVCGDKLVITSQSGQKLVRSIMDFDGKQSQRLFISQDGSFV